jgi:hypothetical protein
MCSRQNAFRQLRKRIFPVMISLLTSASLPALEQVGSGAPRARLDFVVTDCWGRPIDKTEIEIVQQDRKLRIEYPETRSIEVQPGSLQINVWTQGFVPYSEVVEVGGEARLITPCLFVAYIEGKRPRNFSATGTVAGELLSDEPVWVRLVGMYSDFNAASLVDKAGSFSFKALRTGRYYLMLFGNGKLKVAGEIDLSEFESRISIKPGSVTAD